MSLTRQRARVASLTRSRTPDDPALVDARRTLAHDRLERYIADTLATAPELTPEQRERLAGLFAPTFAKSAARKGAPPGRTRPARHGGTTSAVSTESGDTHALGGDAT